MHPIDLLRPIPGLTTTILLNIAHAMLITLAIITAGIHYTQPPSLDFSANTTIYLWPLLPHYIATAFSICYLIWLNNKLDINPFIMFDSLIFAEPFSDNPTLDKFIASVVGRLTLLRGVLPAILSAGVLSVDALWYPVLFFTQQYRGLPSYEVENAAVEGEWLAMFILVFMLVISCWIILHWLWVPVFLILRRWRQFL